METATAENKKIKTSTSSCNNGTNKNAQVLENEIAWFSFVLDTRIKLYFCQECKYESIYDIKLPILKTNVSAYSQFIIENKLSFAERLILILSLIPHIRPQVLDIFFTENTNFSRPFSEFGGWKGTSHGGFLPTGETAAFILAGNDLGMRFEIQRILGAQALLIKKGVLKMRSINDSEPFLSSALEIQPEFLCEFTTGEKYMPEYNINFPAKAIHSPLSWNDLVLPSDVFDEIANIQAWIEHESNIMSGLGMHKVLKPGYRALFYGPPGTGKTLTTTLLGQNTGMDVFRIDLSMVISKYIGETEKNLAKVFEQAKNKNRILFFDEADALFGKRTATSSSNDRYANQEISYLLQKIEDFPGIVILASNLKSNIDDAFSRRFQSMIYFPIPDAEQRLQLWKNTFSQCKLNKDANLPLVAEKYKLSGGAIANIVRYCILQQLQDKKPNITNNNIIKGIEKELKKEGKTL